MGIFCFSAMPAKAAIVFLLLCYTVCYVCLANKLSLSLSLSLSDELILIHGSRAGTNRPM